MDLTRASIAAHRFGLGEPAVASLGDDPVAWLEAQIGPADPLAGPDLLPTAEALKRFPQFVRQVQQQARRAAGPASGPEAMSGIADTPPPAQPDVEAQFRAFFRKTAIAERQAAWTQAVTTPRPFAERLAMHWANHFTVSAAKPRVAGLVGPFEREAIRPNLAAPFRTMLRAAVLHPAMQLYLDNAQSIGPDSVAGRRRQRGLNENLAREILELHTLGVDGGYTQDDVVAFAQVLTGWTLAPDRGDAVFEARRHQPGPKRLLGRRIPEGGADELDAVLDLLVAHPSTARHVATRLARHVVADQPPPALVDRLARRFQDTGGDLGELTRALVRSPEAWHPGFGKLKRPEELALSTWRLLGLRTRVVEGIGGGVVQMGQRVGAAPSPAGWSDLADDWLGPDAMWKRIEWVARVAERMPAFTDARALAEASFGDRLGQATRVQLVQAESGRQALALLLAAPEFQRR